MIRKKEGFQGQRMIVIPRNVLSGKCAREPALTPLFITDIGCYPKAMFHHRKRTQGADQHILIYCTEGKGNVTLRKETYLMEAGDCILLPRKWAHEYSADETDPWTIYWAHFQGTSADSIVETAVREWKGHKIVLQHSPERIPLFERIYEQLQRGYREENLVWSNMNFWSFLSSCIYPEMAKPGKARQRHDNIDQAIDFMNSHLDHMLTLQQMAQSVNLSQSHFCFLFKNNTGFSPIEYFNQLKIQKACQYLLFTQLRIKEVAARLGMEDPCYFSRMFTRVMGVSPNQYRERNA
ncbi:AraC family transcriptional regulator [Chitinophaga arvensicola]|uniref:AraC-type DNA-binding protein n=1 Tax=Chitinophaga arvensicola TaxID=29529 RepID=A0A1I0S8Y5_9BACT|nr:AraC family transcriptional regulator [Chitinophaga arvensicola]SEW52572.1 AraC-type DNA-binding protein [Chitinophaga arvensicola]